jgi:hypothetical protein
MNMKKAFSYLSYLLILLSTACSKGSKDDNNPGGGGGGNLSITSFSPEYVFWGDNVEINGTGFSTNKTDNYVWFQGDGSCGSAYNDSSGWRKGEVLSASATKLVVKTGWTIDGTIPCGHSYAAIRIIVNGKRAESPTHVRYMGFPVPAGFCYWYGGAYYAPGAIRVGDSAMLEFGGHSISNAVATGNISKIRLSVDGKLVPTKLRPGVSGCGSRAVTFELDAEEFGDPSKCEPKDSYWGGTGQKRNFKLYIDGQPQSEVSKEYWVFSLPKPVFGGATGPTSWSKSTGGTPEWTVTGRNMFYNKVRFSAVSPCTGFVEAETTCTNEFCEQFKFGIPLNLLTGGCSYNISLKDVCGGFKSVGTIVINP